MVDIFLHAYKTTDPASALNAPHKYRFAKKKGIDTYMFEDAWKRGKKAVLNRLIQTIKDFFDTTKPFAFAVAPSNTSLFVNDIENAFAIEFTSAINLSRCFSKLNGFDAGKTDTVLSENELRKSIALNSECFNNKLSFEITTILLLDDVFALGNTFSGMKMLINDITKEKTIITASILKTT